MQSPIQDHIIAKLKNADFLRYRDMHPQDVPNDLFNYHLKALIKKDLVEKSSKGYQLSAFGVRYVADTYHTSDQSNRLFKLNVITIVSREYQGSTQVLNQKRTAQPSYGLVGVMGGTIVKGESFQAGASRKLQQETGLMADFRLVGLERRMLYKEGMLFSDVLFPICYAATYSGRLQNITEFGENYWVNIDKAIQNDSRAFDSIEAIPKVLVALKEGRINTLPLFYDEVIQK